MKHHEIRELVNELTKIAQDYGQTQQLRDRISRCVQRAVSPQVAQLPTMLETILVDDTVAEVVGNKLVTLLGLECDKFGRFHTDAGLKSCLGLARCVSLVVNDATSLEV